MKHLLICNFDRLAKIPRGGLHPFDIRDNLQTLEHALAVILFLCKLFNLPGQRIRIREPAHLAAELHDYVGDLATEPIYIAVALHAEGTELLPHDLTLTKLLTTDKFLDATDEVKLRRLLMLMFIAVRRLGLHFLQGFI